MPNNTRLYTLQFLLLTLFILIFLRVISLNVFKQEFLRKKGDARVVRVVTSAVPRGMITDRNGEPLAVSTPVESIWVNPKEFEPQHPNILPLAARLDLSVNELQQRINKNINKEFIYLARQINPALAQSIKKLQVPGIHFKSEYKRFYPLGEVTSHLVGFTNIDDRGQEGLELAYDHLLKGQEGVKKVLRDRLGREVSLLEGIRESRPGQDLALSIDSRLQYLAYKELKKAVLEHKAQSGSIVILDIANGEVLAMVNDPAFNPNKRVRLRDSSYRNRAVTDVFEPGSVMKTFSVVNALINSSITPSSKIDTSPGWLALGNNIVKEDQGRNYGVMDVATILQKSSNVGVAKLTLQQPIEKLYKTYQQLGFGQITNSNFPGEASGYLTPLQRNQHFIAATMAFGYGLNTTVLQLAQAYAILGSYGIKRPVSLLTANTSIGPTRVLTQQTATQVLDMLSLVVELGGGNKAKVIGYKTAGKTGTARKVSQNGGYDAHSHLALFAGIVPANSPRFAIVVMIDDPRGEVYYGSQVAAPLFAKVAQSALRIFNVAPNLQEMGTIRLAHYKTE